MLLFPDMAFKVLTFDIFGDSFHPQLNIERIGQDMLQVW